jgi:hypothetical protein
MASGTAVGDAWSAVYSTAPGGDGGGGGGGGPVLPPCDVSGTSECELQAEIGDFTYWIYEANTDKGVYSKEGLEMMDKAEQLIIGHADWKDRCNLQYSYDVTSEEWTSECSKPLSALNFYKASNWNSELVTDVLDR